MSTADELRRAFDGAFSLPIDRSTTELVDFLAIRLGGDPHAIRLSEITALIADRPITRVPANAPSLLGLVGLRGTMVPVFDLGERLGYPPISAAPRWIATSGQLGFAFETLEGHLRVAAAAIGRQAAPASTHDSEVIRVDEQLRSIVRLDSVVATIVRKER